MHTSNGIKGMLTFSYGVNMTSIYRNIRFYNSSSNDDFQCHNIIILLVSGQSYKGSTIVNYDSRVVTWGIFKSGMTLES